MNIGVVDSSFPSKRPFGFRNREIGGLLDLNPSTTAFSPFPMLPGEDAWFQHGYGVGKDEFLEKKAAYAKHYPERSRQIQYLKQTYSKPFLALTYFLADTYTYLQFFEKNNIPFCFVLYPGGGFGVNNSSSDAMLARIFSSPQFRRVIVTSDITETYIRDIGICEGSKIESLWGGVSQFDPNDFTHKKFFSEEKETLDIIFVAFKYSPQGYDKGYDLYLKVAKKITAKNKQVIFHIVGDFSPQDSEVAGLEGSIVFHGPLFGEELKKLYQKADIQISLSRSNTLFRGNFDGFPLGIDAFFSNTVLMTSDDLNQNGGRFSPEEFCSVKLNVNDIVSKIQSYLKRPHKLRKTAEAGVKKADKILNVNRRVTDLNTILKSEAHLLRKEARAWLR